VKDTRDRYANTEINWLLQWMEADSRVALLAMPSVPLGRLAFGEGSRANGYSSSTSP
jgi:hypothetical protein